MLKIKQNLTLVFTALFVGFIVSFVAQIFALTAKYLYFLTTKDKISTAFNVEIFGNELNLLTLISCLIASIFVCILIKLKKIERWHGPADTIYAAHQKAGSLDTKMGFYSTLASFFSISGGASVGMYGPLVHFGGTIGAYLRRRPFIPNIPHDIILGSGVAAAISAGFGSPIAGIIFAHEVVLRHFSMRALAAISLASIIASFSAKKINLVEPVLIFEEIPFDLLEAFPGLFIVGIFSSIIALCFMKSLLMMTKLSNNSNMKFFFKPLIPGIICGLVGLFFPEAIGLGSETIVNVITENNTLILLTILLFLKIFLTSLCIGFGLFGGILSPALLVGACAGAIICGLPFISEQQNLNAVLAVSAMGAVVSSVIGGPITAIILILELTNSYHYAIASILPIAFSNLITYLFFGSSFFDHQLKLRNIPIDFGRQYILLNQTKIKDYISKEYLTLNSADTTNSALKKFKQNNTTEGYFVSKNKKLIGKLKLINILDKKKLAINYVENDPIIIKSDTSIAQTISTLEKFVGENIPIVNEDNVLLGVISENDVLIAYSDITKSIKNIEKN